MTKRNKIIYWTATVLLAFGMMAQGLAQLAHTKGYVDILVRVSPVFLVHPWGLETTGGNGYCTTPI